MEAVSDLTDKVFDAWTTVKVESAPLYSSAVDCTSVNVNTSEGIVT